jgi:prephenate dehydrogenase
VEPFRCVAVLSPGLIGGSLLRALRSRCPEVKLRAWVRREDAVSELLAEEGLVEAASTDVNEAVSGADCIILAMPTGHMRSVVEKMNPFPAGSDVLVTDVGSVKEPVVEDISSLVRALGGRFLGSHPMAGSEKKGMGHADADLFQGAAVILTPEEPGEDLSRLSAFWESLGGVVSVVPPRRHDELVAAISHLPHLVAAALARSVLTRSPDAAAYSGGGFRDTTRVSGGPEDMWTGILADNQAAVSKELGVYISELECWKEALDTLDRDRLHSFLSEARQLRESL